MEHPDTTNPTAFDPYSTNDIFLLTSLTSGSSAIITATSRLEHLLKSHKIPFKPVDLATDARARRIWSSKGNGRRLPGVARDGEILGVSCLSRYIDMLSSACGNVWANKKGDRTLKSWRNGTSMESSSRGLELRRPRRRRRLMARRKRRRGRMLWTGAQAGQLLWLGRNQMLKLWLSPTVVPQEVVSPLLLLPLPRLQRA